jgi:hypothetical protein
VRPTDDVAADPVDEVNDQLAPDEERPVRPAGAGGPGEGAVPDEERPVGPGDDAPDITP